MDLTTWLLTLGGLTVAVIVIDGLRRMFASHAALRIDIDESLCGLAQDEFPSELPNGGARVVDEPISNDFWSSLGDTPQIQHQSQSQSSSTVNLSTATPEQHEVRAVEDLIVEDITLEKSVEILVVADLTTDNISLVSSPLNALANADLGHLDSGQLKDLTHTSVVALNQSDKISSSVHSPVELSSENQGPSQDLTSVYLSLEEIAALTNPVASTESSIASEAPESSIAAPDFDPTRPVHELVETVSMVQSDLFAEQDLTALTCVKSHLAHELLETSDDILFSDTGIENTLIEESSTNNAEPDSHNRTLSARLAKVTSMTFGKTLLSRKKVAAQQALINDAKEQRTKDVPAVEQVISILVTASDSQGFYGPQLLQLVEACGLVHGDMEIFHRYEDGPRLGKTQFSMANMMEPGTFEISEIDHLHTPGVVFFLGLPTAQDSMQAFDFMLETAQCLASNLGGEVLDEQRSVMRPQTIEHCRQQIRDFERRNMTRRAQL